MAKKGKNRKSNPDSVCCHVRRNPATGQEEFFYPLEITEVNKEFLEAYAREYGMEICVTHYGNRNIRAVMVPCRQTVKDRGLERFLDTSTEDQHRLYNKLTRPDLAEQDRVKHDGRCQVADGRGGTRRCPLREENPDYIPGSTARGTRFKTRLVSCEGCPYEQNKAANTVIPFSKLDHEDEDGEKEPFEPYGFNNFQSSECFFVQHKEFILYVREHKPEFAPLLEMICYGYSQAEAGRILGISSSTVSDRMKKLRQMQDEFRLNCIEP